MRDVIGYNSTARLFKTINRIGFFCGLPNMWVDKVHFSKRIDKILKIYRLTMLLVITGFVCMEWGSFFTQTNLTEKQKGQLLMFAFAHPFYLLWITVPEYKKDDIADVLHQLAVVLKEVYNDEAVEMQMVRKAKKSGLGFSAVFMIAYILFGCEGTMLVLRGEGTFTTVVTLWPDVLDNSALANVGRVAIYLLFGAFMTRVCVVYVVIITTMICLSHQFKNMQSYFYSLCKIFHEDLTQREKEVKYEKAFIAGVRMHSKTLRYTKKCQAAYGVILSCQVLLGFVVLVMLMSQMMNSDRELENVIAILTTGAFILISTAFFMWNAGDVTVEAEAMATAMYGSGWHNCEHSVWKVRRLLVIAVMQSQKPVTIWALGIVALSYPAYVSMVRTSYSVFSVLY